MRPIWHQGSGQIIWHSKVRYGLACLTAPSTLMNLCWLTAVLGHFEIHLTCSLHKRYLVPLCLMVAWDQTASLQNSIQIAQGLMKLEISQFAICAPSRWWSNGPLVQAWQQQCIKWRFKWARNFHPFDDVPVILSSWNFQDDVWIKKSRSEVKCQGYSLRSSEPNLAGSRTVNIGSVWIHLLPDGTNAIHLKLHVDS